MNALRLLMNQHDRVEKKMIDLLQARERGGDAWQAIASEFTSEVRRHFELEESHFYPAIEPRLVLVSVHRFIAEHRQVNRLLEELGNPMTDADLAQCLNKLHGALVQHMSDEEIELFPEVKRRFGLDELEELGDRLEQAAPAGEARAESAPPNPEP